MNVTTNFSPHTAPRDNCLILATLPSDTKLQSVPGRATASQRVITSAKTTLSTRHRTFIAQGALDRVVGARP